MLQRRILPFLLACVLAVFACAPSLSLAANPPDYEKAKQQLESLKAGKKGVGTWLECAEAFRKAYDNNPKWRLRIAALYRCGIALEERARITKLSSDARKAATVYEQAARAYPETSLADDSLFRAAVVHNELLKDRKKALLILEHIKRRYARADFAAAAEEYGEKLRGQERQDRKAEEAKRAPEKKAAKSGKSAKAAEADNPAKDGKSAKAAEADNPAKDGKSAKAAEADNPTKDGKNGKGSKGGKEGKGKAAPQKMSRSEAAATLAAQLGLSVRTIVLDPGHGGRDPGTMHHGVVEQDVNLDVVKRLRTILQKNGYKVLLTRDRNKWISLGERVRFGKRSKGDLFVSIHVNACDNPKIQGFETYILDFARNSSASRLAIIENADSGRLGDMDKILTEILTGARTAESRRLAERIQKNAVEYLKKKGFSVRSGGVKGAPFFVLVGSSMPSVLVEIGYCTNKAEASRLKTERYRQRIAEGIAQGIHAYARSLSRK